MEKRLNEVVLDRNGKKASLAGEGVWLLSECVADVARYRDSAHDRMSSVRLVYSAGVKPARARVRGPVAWIVRRKETKS